MSYAKKLQNPLWQKKRLEILQRDGFKCLHCGCNDKELHVHHRWYQFGKDIWDYPDTCFETLCFECHEYIEMCIKSSTSDMQLIVRKTLLAQDDFDVINRLLIHLSDEGYRNYNSRKLVDAIDYIINNNTIDIIIKNELS
jgi:hypothetical protein